MRCGSQRTAARCPAALTVAALTPSTPTSACSMMPAQAAQYMPDRRKVDSAMRSPSLPVDQRVKRCCSSGSSSTAMSGADSVAGAASVADVFIASARGTDGQAA